MLNPAKSTPTDTFNLINFEKEEGEVFILTEVAAAICGLKSGKLAGEDKIRPEILKALNEEEYCVTIRRCKISRLLYADDLALLTSSEYGLPTPIKWLCSCM